MATVPDIVPQQVATRRLVTDLDEPDQRELVRRARYGVIETADERLVSIQLRRWPRRAGPFDLLLGRTLHRRRPGNRCRLFYNQPVGHDDFLALKFTVSGRGTSFATFRAALRVLDEIARIKGTHAIVCDVANRRISDRLMARWGWEAHLPSRWHRHFIKRFDVRRPGLAQQAVDAVHQAVHAERLA